jgi:hypothetical protein
MKAPMAVVPMVATCAEQALQSNNSAAANNGRRQITVTTGMRISGKISVCIDRMAATPRNRINAATT